MKTFAIIGLGKFGYHIAEALAKLEDVNVIAIDNDEQKVQEMSEHIQNAFVLDSTNPKALEEAGIYNLDTVIVSIGENIEASILTVMALKDLGNKHIIAKAITPTHGEILAKIGAFKVVYPEKIAAKKLIKNLIGDITVDMIDVSNHIKVIKLIATDKIVGKTLTTLEHENQNIRAMAHKVDGDWDIFNLDKRIQKGDMLAFYGNKNDIEQFFKEIF